MTKKLISEEIWLWQCWRETWFLFGSRNKQAGYQQYTIATEDTVTKIPPSLTYDDVSTIPVGLTAAWIGLYQVAPTGFGSTAPLEERGQYAGKPFVVLGGSSSVGQFTIQLAKLSGFSPIITTSSLKHEDFLKSIGATHVVDRNKPLAEEVTEITSDPIEYVYDAISVADTQKAGYELLASGGQIALVLPQSITKVDDKAIAKVFGVLTVPEHCAVLVKMYAKLYNFLEEGVIKPNRVEVVPGGLAGIIEGLKKLEANEVSGIKLVGHPQESA